MSPAVNVTLEEVPFAILETVKARILANRRRLDQSRSKPRASVRPRPQYRRFGASSKAWRKPQHGGGVFTNDEVGLWKTGDIGTENVNSEFKGWFGVRFTAVVDFDINYLGGFDNLNNGLQRSYPIRVWRVRGNQSPAIILDTSLKEGLGDWTAGAYCFTEIPVLAISKDDTIAITIYYEPFSESGLQEDRYRYYDGNTLTVVAQANPNLVKNVKLVETTSNSINSYPLNEQFGLFAVNINFATDVASDTSPDWLS